MAKAIKMVSGFAELVGSMLDVLHVVRLRILGILIMFPEGISWKELVLKVEKSGGTLGHHINYLTEKELVEKREKKYYITGWGRVAFDFALRVFRYMSHTTPPPYISKEEFEELKLLSNDFLEFLRANGYEDYSKEALP